MYISYILHAYILHFTSVLIISIRASSLELAHYFEIFDSVEGASGVT